MNGDFDMPDFNTPDFDPMNVTNDQINAFMGNLITGDTVIFMPPGSVENKVEYLAQVVDTLVSGGLNEDGNKPRPPRPPRPPMPPHGSYSQIMRFTGIVDEGSTGIHKLDFMFHGAPESEFHAPKSGSDVRAIAGRIVTMSMKLINPVISSHSNENFNEAYFQLRNIPTGVAVTQHVKIMPDTFIFNGDNNHCNAININVTFEVGFDFQNEGYSPIYVYFFDKTLSNLLDVSFDKIEYYGYTVS